MKLIDVPSLTEMNMLFNSVACDGVELRLRLELYSCKATAATKSLARSFDDERQLRASSALDSDTALALNRKTLLYLLDTLNESLPDYDFSHTSIDLFALQPSPPHVQAQIDTHLASCVPHYAALYAARLWAAVAAELDSLDDVEIYTYVGDDPFAAADAEDDAAAPADDDDDDARDASSAAAAPSSALDLDDAAADVDDLEFLVPPPADSSDVFSSPVSSSPAALASHHRRQAARARRRRPRRRPAEPLWSFNYFFFDRKRKRVLLWYAFVRSTGSGAATDPIENVAEWEME